MSRMAKIVVSALVVLAAAMLLAWVLSSCGSGSA